MNNINDIRVFVLSSGQPIIGFATRLNTGDWEVTEPHFFGLSQDQENGPISLQLAPLWPQQKRNFKIYINPEYSFEPDDDMKNAYNIRFGSGIVLPK